MMMIEHVHLPHPEGGADAARSFWTEIMGFREIEKPPVLRDEPGGGWFRHENAEVHIGNDPDFHPITVGHPAFMVVGLDALAERLEGHGFATDWDDTIPGRRRFFIFDPAGNRLEFFTDTGEGE